MSRHTKTNSDFEHLYHLSRSTAKQKLEWLEEARKFLDKLPRRIRKLHEKFWKGEI